MPIVSCRSGNHAAAQKTVVKLQGTVLSKPLDSGSKMTVLPSCRAARASMSHLLTTVTPVMEGDTCSGYTQKSQAFANPDAAHSMEYCAAEGNSLRGNLIVPSCVRPPVGMVAAGSEPDACMAPLALRTVHTKSAKWRAA